ncbi:hypothetical protein L3Y34_013155 [Caenorhabditis briggsae]|uniref:Uncharacterized protein n=1 Tax=Caenorhabditis briggsae TaxID=6238 RepID=A0AAE9CXH2_CAEBR|nr:hypothetical protein L3Y34_013155 [Caenorhabditis briggsae]
MIVGWTQIWNAVRPGYQYGMKFGLDISTDFRDIMQQATSSLYVSNAVSDWCKGMCSKKTPKILRTKIEVIFYCNRDMVFPSLRTIVQCILILLAINAILSTLSEL